jgi:hypothetical protein
MYVFHVHLLSACSFVYFTFSASWEFRIAWINGRFLYWIEETICSFVTSSKYLGWHCKFQLYGLAIEFQPLSLPFPSFRFLYYSFSFHFSTLSILPLPLLFCFPFTSSLFLIIYPFTRLCGTTMKSRFVSRKCRNFFPLRLSKPVVGAKLANLHRCFFFTDKTVWALSLSFRCVWCQA